MNLNNSSSSSSSLQQLQLKKAVEEQLDLILKMQEERKALKKQNKLLYLKIKQINDMMTKYRKEMKSVQVNTDQSGCVEGNEGVKLNIQNSIGSIKNSQISKNSQVQVQIESPPPITNSKLIQVQQFLKNIETNESRIESYQIKKQNELQQKKPKQKQKQDKLVIGQNSKNYKNNIGQFDKQVTSEILKITKQLNCLKKQLKQSEHRYKLREKQIKDLKKCLENKNQALEKSRKQFNQLSQILNSDKCKSLRNMQQQIASLKSKLLSQEDNTQLKNMLQALTRQYEQYKKETEKKIDILVEELANKQKQVESLESEKKRIHSNIRI